MDSLEAWLPVILVPALTLSILAQLFVQFVFSRSGFVKTKMSGYAVARHVLDGAAMYDVPVEQVPGQLSDHYDARRRILQLSGDVYHGRNVAAVATAAHEACHALQNARRNRLLIIREIAIPAASLGSGGGILIALAGLVSQFPPLLALGVILFSATLYVQLLNLPVELHASSLARRRLVELGIVEPEQLSGMRWSLAAVSLTYIAATLQGVLTLAQRFASLFGQQRRDPH